MVEQTAKWPSHGYAKNARDDSAELAATIRAEAMALVARIENNNLSEQTLLVGLIKISTSASDILRLLERQGAPTMPTEPK